MITDDVVQYHLREALQAGLAEMIGDHGLARYLRAETKMRLVSMSEDDLWELVRVTCPPDKTFEQVYMNYRQAIEELKASADWMKDLESYESEHRGRR